MSTTSAHARLLKAAPWALADGFITIIQGFVTFYVIAWLLTPHEVGLATTAISLVILVEAFSSAGLQDALIQSKYFDKHTVASARVTALILATIGALSSVVVGFSLSLTMNEPLVFPLTTVCATVIVINAISIAHSAKLSRRMRASSLTRRLLFSKIASVASMVVAGLWGAGPWTLVIGNVVAAVTSSAALMTATKIKTEFGAFSVESSKALLRFGALVSMEAILWAVSLRVFLLSFGTAFGVRELGLLQLATRLVDEIARLLQSAMGRLGLSYFSELARGKQDIAGPLALSTGLLFAIAAPAFTGLAIVAPTLIPLLFGQKWLDSVLYVQLLAIGWVLIFPRFLLAPALKSIRKFNRLLPLNIAATLYVLALSSMTARLDPAQYVWGWILKDAATLIPAIAIAWIAMRAKPWGFLLRLTVITLNTTAMVATIILIDNYLSQEPLFKIAIIILSGSVSYGILTLVAFKRPLNLEFRRFV